MKFNVDLGTVNWQFAIGPKLLGQDENSKSWVTWLSFAQFGNFLRKLCLFFYFSTDLFDIIVNFIIQKLKNKHTFLKKLPNWAKLSHVTHDLEFSSWPRGLGLSEAEATLIKFRFSEKATQIWKNIPLVQLVSKTVKLSGIFFSNFVAFLQYLNFKYQPCKSYKSGITFT